jgi:hypothetical protein
LMLGLPSSRASTCHQGRSKRHASGERDRAAAPARLSLQLRL